MTTKLHFSTSENYSIRPHWSNSILQPCFLLSPSRNSWTQLCKTLQPKIYQHLVYSSYASVFHCRLSHHGRPTECSVSSWYLSSPAPIPIPPTTPNKSSSPASYTRPNIIRSHVLCLTLLPFVSPPSESWAHTLRDFPPLLQSSSQPATVLRSSDCSDGQFSLRYSKPSDRITAAESECKLETNIMHKKDHIYII